MANREERDDKARLRDAEEAGCYGLMRGVAKNLHTDEEWQADVAHKLDGPFYCPSCFSDAVVRKCSEKKDHFAHKARLSPVLRPHEKLLHDACTREICNALSLRFPDGKWAVERPIPERTSERLPALVPDISGRVGEQRVAIEVQASALTIPKIVQRTQGYARRGIALLWIVPLREELGHAPFRPRLYERYLHSIFYGRTYYWWPGLGLTVKSVHYGSAERHIEYREWVEDGVQQSAGGFNARYKTIKTPVYGPDLDLDTDFVAKHRGAFTPDNELKEVPACFIWKDRKVEWWETPPR